MPRRHGQRKKGNTKNNNKNVVAPKPTLIENKKVVAEEPVVTKVVATEVSAASAKGRLRQVVESEKVEKVVSYFSSYAPTLLSFYGNVKERLPETLKTNVDVLEKDYVVPATAFTVVKCDQILTQVDETLASTEETVYKTVEKTKETVTSTVEQTKETVTSTVEQTKETVTNAVVSTLNVGLDTIETGLDYALPAAEEKKEVVAEEEKTDVMKRVSVLNNTLRTRLTKLALVAAIHEKKELATAALKEKYTTTETLFKERYVVIDKEYLKPAVKFVNDQYVVLDIKYFQPAKSFVSEKYVVVDTAYLKPTKQFAESNVLYPTKQFFDGLSKELKWTESYTKYVPEATQVKEYVEYGYKTVQSNVLLPTACYLGVDETFVSYEKYVLENLSKVVEPYVTLQKSEEGTENVVVTEGDGGAVAIEESEDWQDAPVKPNKFEPVYPSDEEWLHEQEDNYYQTMIYETNSVY